MACSVSGEQTAEKSPSAIVSQSGEQTQTGPLARKDVQVVQVTGNIKKINRKKRQVTVELPDGLVKTLEVSPEAKRFSEVKVGDSIVVKQYEALAYEVRQPTADELKNPRVEIAAGLKTKEELPPGVATTMITHVIVTVKGIDLENETVTIKYPEGHSETIKARYPENLKRVKVGDTAAITYLKAVAIQLDPKN